MRDDIGLPTVAQRSDQTLKLGHGDGVALVLTIEATCRLLVPSAIEETCSLKAVSHPVLSYRKKYLLDIELNAWRQLSQIDGDLFSEP